MFGARALGAAFVLCALGLGGCAQQPQQVAAAGHSKEYFPSSVYGRASRRVIEDGQPIPRGGGQYLVGKPYTVAGQTYYPSERHVTQVGLASWYGDAFHGRLTANGEIYDRDSFTAAHPTMPLPSYARVTNLRNNTSMIVRVNDRGPYNSNRVMDVSRRVAEALDIRRAGTAKVRVEWVSRASLAGSDDTKLAATLRTDGPARLEGIEERIMTAAISAPARIASLGNFVPDPPRPVPVAEDERPEQLETYRAPRPVHHQAEAPPPRREIEQDEETPRAQRTRAASIPEASRAPDDEEEPTTGSIRSRREAAHGRAGRDEEISRVARIEPTTRMRDMRPRYAERVPPILRHGEANAERVPPVVRHGEANAKERLLPPPRPSRLASVLPPARPRAGTRTSKPHRA